MTKVYISQPMRGISDAKIIVLREKLFELFGEFGGRLEFVPADMDDVGL